MFVNLIWLHLWSCPATVIMKMFCNGESIMQGQGNYRQHWTLIILFQETVIIQEFEKADFQILKAISNQIKYFLFQSKFKEGKLR